MENGSDILRTADAHYRAGRYAAAAEMLQPLAERQPPSAAALRMLGLCRLRLGDAVAAIGLLGQAHELAPQDPWGRLHYGVGLHAVGRHAEAAVLFRSCQADLPDDPAPWLNLAASLIELGQHADAIRAAAEAVTRAPSLGQAHYMLGLAHAGAGQAEPSRDAFRAATDLGPGFALAWLNLGVACYRCGDLDAAKAAMRAVLRIEPSNEAAASNLANFLRLSGEPVAAEDLLRALIARPGGAPAARLNLAAAPLQEDRAGDALALLDGAPPERADIRQPWQLQRVLALIQCGRLAEARTEIAGIGPLPPSLKPLLPWRLALLALSEGEVERAREQALAMDTALDANLPAMLPEHGIMAHYDLAKLWSGLHEPGRAFSHWIAGHRLLGRFQPFSRQAHAAFIDATIASFNEARLRSGPTATDRDPTPVFVVGMPRSGTTLVEQILSAHGQVFGAGERPELDQLFARLGGHGPMAEASRRIASLDTAALDAAAAPYLAALHALDPAAARIVDKMPGNALHLGLVAQLLPGARIIVCERDPRDIGLSIFTYRFYGHHPYAHDLSDLGWYIAQHRKLMAHWIRVLPNPIMTLHLREWSEDFDGTLRRVLAFLDLPYDPNCERFHESSRRVRTASRAQVREPVHARGLGRWRQYEDHLAPLIAALRDAGELDAIAESE